MMCKRLGMKKIICLITIVAIVLGYKFYVALRYLTDITEEEKRIIENYYDPEIYNAFINPIILGEEKLNDNQTIYYTVSYDNEFTPMESLSKDKLIKITPYTEKTRKELSECKWNNIYALDIFITTGEGPNMSIVDQVPGVWDGMEIDPYARIPMLIKAMFYRASRKKLAQMDADNQKRMEALGYKLWQNAVATE